jgi:hypothetical protein
MAAPSWTKVRTESILKIISAISPTQASNMLSSASPIENEIWTTKEKMRAKKFEQGRTPQRRRTNEITRK